MIDNHKLEDRFSTSTFMASSPSKATTLERTSSVSAPASRCHSPNSSSDAFTENSEPLPEAKLKKNRGGTGFVYRIREHVKIGPKFSETVKGKLTVGAKIIKKGGRENIFKDIFGMNDGERLFKASQCYLSTTAGPIAGILFISSEKIAFCSERSIAVHSPSGGLIRTLYKLSVPVKKIKGVHETENANNPSQKYIEVVTRDHFEFWFMGFLRYEKAFTNLQRAISLSQGTSEEIP